MSISRATLFEMQAVNPIVNPARALQEQIKECIGAEAYFSWLMPLLNNDTPLMQACQEKLAELELHAVEAATSAEPIPDEEAEIADTLAMVGGEFTNFPTYDQLINGAKFTDEHRAHVRQVWNEMYKDGV